MYHLCFKKFYVVDIRMNSNHVYDPMSDLGASKRETGNVRYPACSQYAIKYIQERIKLET